MLTIEAAANGLCHDSSRAYATEIFEIFWTNIKAIWAKRWEALAPPWNALKQHSITVNIRSKNHRPSPWCRASRAMDLKVMIPSSDGPMDNPSSSFTPSIVDICVLQDLMAIPNRDDPLEQVSMLRKNDVFKDTIHFGANNFYNLHMMCHCVPYRYNMYVYIYTLSICDIWDRYRSLLSSHRHPLFPSISRRASAAASASPWSAAACRAMAGDARGWCPAAAAPCHSSVVGWLGF